MGKKQAYGVIAQVSAVDDKVQEQRAIPPEIEVVLEKFESVFKEPQGLPPEKSQDPTITLKEGPNFSRSGCTSAPMYRRLK